MHDDHETWFYLNDARRIGASFSVSVEVLRRAPEAQRVVANQRVVATADAERTIMDAAETRKWDGVIVLWEPWVDSDIDPNNAYAPPIAEYRRHGMMYHAPRVRSVSVSVVASLPPATFALIGRDLVETSPRPMASTAWRSGVGVVVGGVLFVTTKE